MKKIAFLFLILILILYLSGCGSSKEKSSNFKYVTAEKPTPIGGDEAVREVFQVLLDDDYEEIRGVNVEFTMWVNDDGYINDVSQVIGIKDNKFLEGAIVSKLKDIMINHIRFTYYKVEGQYEKRNSKNSVFYYFLIDS